LGSGTDSSLALALILDVTCAASVLAVVAWRLTTGRAFTIGARAVAAVTTGVVVVALVVFAAVGPLRPGWSRRAGTSAALLAQLARKNAAASTPSTGSPATPTTSNEGATGVGSGVVPAPPFSLGLVGSQSTSAPNSQGQVEVTLSMHLQDASSTSLTVVLDGTAIQGGGVAMSSGSVTFGGYHGVVTSLSGGTLGASISSPTPTTLVLSLAVDQATGALSGTATGTRHEGGSR
jgi:hypothetical protein